MLYAHNQRPFEELRAAFHKYRSVLLACGTGTGKSYIADELIEALMWDLNVNNVLVLSPKRAINDQWKKLLEPSYGDHVDYMTYQMLSRLLIEEIAERYDLVILDEAHHIGAATWGRAVKQLRELGHACFLGLTADSKRYSDGGTDVANTFFEKKVNGLNILEAIEQNVLPGFTYVSVLYDLEQQETSLQEDARASTTTKVLFRKLDLWKNENSIADIFNRHMPKNRRKVLVFAPSINEMKGIRTEIEKMYPDADAYTIHSGQALKTNQIEIEAFEASAESAAILYSVNMLNEGVHIHGVNTIIMMRGTQSPTIYFQQIGRMMDASAADENDHLIFDLVNNHKRLRISNGFEAAPIIVGGKRILSDPGDHIIIHDYATTAEEMLHEIRRTLNGFWSEAEDQLLKERYTSTRTEDLLPLFPGKTMNMIYHRARALGLTDARNWSPEEDEILRKHYSSCSLDELAEMLPERTKQAIQGRRKSLGLMPNVKRWTEEEVAILREYYPKEGRAVSKRLPGRSALKCQGKATELGLSAPRNWSEEEDAILRDYYGSEGCRVAERLPGRTKDTCAARARALGLTRKNWNWTTEEDHLIRTYYPSEGSDTAKRLPGRSESQVRGRASHLNVKCKKKKK